MPIYFFRYLYESLENFKPNLIVYNAGTDILKGDPLGQMNVSVEVRHNVF